MLVVVGTMIKRKCVGWAASFCPFCRRVTPHRALALRQVRHMHGVTIGRGEYTADETICQGCRVAQVYAPGSVRPVPELGADLDAAARESGPWPAAELAARLDLERRAIAGRVSMRERRELMEEPFRAIAYAHEWHGRYDGRRTVTFFLLLIAGLGVVGSTFYWFFHMAGLSPRPLPIGPALSTLVALALAVLVVRRLRTDTACITRARVLPPLAASLRALRPTIDEISDIRAALATEGVAPARDLEARLIADAIAQPR